MKFVALAAVLGIAAGVLAVLVAAPEDDPLPDAAPGYAERSAPVSFDDGEIVMPVVGVDPEDLTDSYRMPRSGGRTHLAIDIFADRGTPVVAITDGTLESVGTNTLGGKVVWLRSRTGRYAFYYAHLDAHAPGLREGQTVARGDTLGTVGTTGNAKATPPHLHLQMVLRAGGRETPMNPYGLLRFLEVRQRISGAPHEGG
ncbi:MAG: M23 family metallopeptidase [Bacteroidota bacterium]